VPSAQATTISVLATSTPMFKTVDRTGLRSGTVIVLGGRARSSACVQIGECAGKAVKTIQAKSKSCPRMMRFASLTASYDRYFVGCGEERTAPIVSANDARPELRRSACPDHSPKGGSVRSPPPTAY
jgi:hypothetical protein